MPFFAMRKGVPLVFGAFRPHGEMAKLAETLRQGAWFSRSDLLKTIATKHPEEPIARLKLIGKRRYFENQTDLWDIEESNGQIRMTNIRPL
jgi:hypothetical protein